MDPSQSTHTLLVVAGGAGLSSLQTLAAASYLGAFFRVAGPLVTRLTLMGGLPLHGLPHFLWTRCKRAGSMHVRRTFLHRIRRRWTYRPPLLARNYIPSHSWPREGTSCNHQGTPPQQPQSPRAWYNTMSMADGNGRRRFRIASKASLTSSTWTQPCHFSSNTIWTRSSSKRKPSQGGHTPTTFLFRGLRAPTRLSPHVVAHGKTAQATLFSSTFARNTGP